MARSSEKRQMPRTEEVALMAAEAGSVESLAGTILLDRYRLIELLGSGGAAAVYKAEHSIMHKALAVKVLRPECAVREEFVRRFIGEARMVGKLRHDHIVDVIDIGRTEQGIVFCVMEYLEGETLADTVLREGPMPLPRAQAIMMQVCSALAAAHAVNVVHRDVKPENCFRTRRKGNADFIKLLDFGIAKQLDAATGLTNTGVVMGTAEYMSPEQARGSAGVDARADVYSVGAMLFELLTGLPPFMGDGFLEVLMKHATDPIPRITSVVDGLPPAMDHFIERALAKKPADRFATMEDLMATLVAVGEATVLAPMSGLVEAAVEPAIPPPLAVTSTMPTPVAATGRHDRPARTTPRVGVLAAIALACVLVVAAVLVAMLAGSDAPEAQVDARVAETPQSTSKPSERGVSEGAEEKATVSRAERRAVRRPVPEQHTASDRDHVNFVAAEAPQESGNAVPEEQPRRVSDPGSGGRRQKAVEGRLKQRVQLACREFLKFEDKTIRVVVPKSGEPTVMDSPHAYHKLQECVRRSLDDTPTGTYRFRVERQTRSSGAGQE